MSSSISQTNHSAGVRLVRKNPRHRSRFQAMAGRQLVALMTAALVVSSSFMLRVKAADGDPDPTFGFAGKVITDFFGGGDIGNNVAVQPDGKIIVPGRVVTPDGYSDFGLARYDSDGTPDVTFGIGGKVNTDFFGFLDGCFAVAVQTDGKIVAAGGAFVDDNNNNFALTRYNSDGSIDASFGTGGKVSNDFGGGANDEALDVVLQSDGKIVVVIGQAVGTNPDFRLSRYNSDGTSDAGFGFGGTVTTDFFGGDDFPVGLALQSDGKFIAVGGVTNSVGDSDFGLARYNGDGTPDATFGIGGKVATDFFGDADGANDIAVQGDGKIIAVGTATVSIFEFDFAVARYDNTGAPDATFGVGGKVTTNFLGTDSAGGIVLQCDGGIVVAGTANGSNISGDMAVARYLGDGSLDPAFGIGGKVFTEFLGRDSGRGVALQSDGKIVVAGTTRPDDSFDTLDFALARYEGTGCVAAPCPKSQGHWKNNPSIWPVNSLTLGSQSYTKAELLAILKTSTQTDASLILVRQLIAAKLNLENGSDPAPVSSTIAHADALLSGFSGKLPYKVKPSSAKGQAMTADAVVLASYNNALLTPGCAP